MVVLHYGLGEKIKALSQQTHSNKVDPKSLFLEAYLIPVKKLTGCQTGKERISFSMSLLFFSARRFMVCVPGLGAY
jgi:hypothetical protein